MPQQERINSYVDLSAIEKETKIFVDNLNLIVAKMAEISKSAEANGIALGKAVPKEVQTNLQQTNKLMTEAVEVEKKMTVASIQYEKAIEEAKQAKQAYNYELKKTVEAETAAAGSLKQMRAQLSMVNKQYDALSKAERENAAIGGQLQKQSASLTAELKKLEAATGRNQRNVGNYAEAINVATMSLGQMRQTLRSMKNADVSAFNPEQLAAYNRNMALLTDEMGDYNARLRAAGDGTDNMIDAMNGLVGVVQVGLGVMSAFGIENKNLEKTMITLMSVSQGLSSIHKMMEAQTLKVAAATIKSAYATTSDTIATYANNKAKASGTGIISKLWKVIAANPMLALVAGIAAVTAGIISMVNAMKPAQNSFDKLAESQAELLKETTGVHSKLEILRLKINEVGITEQTRNKYLKEYNTLATKAGLRTISYAASTDELNRAMTENMRLLYARSFYNAAQAEMEKLTASYLTLVIERNKGVNMSEVELITTYKQKMDDLMSLQRVLEPYLAQQQANLNLTNKLAGGLKKTTAETDKNTSSTKEQAGAIKDVVKEERAAIIAAGELADVTQETADIAPQLGEAMLAVFENNKQALYDMWQAGKLTYEQYGDLFDMIKEREDAQEQDDKKRNETRKQQILEFTDYAMGLFQSIDDYKTAREDAELQRYEQQQTAQAEALAQRLASGQINQAQYDAAIAGLEEQADQRNAEIAQRRAKRERALASFNVAITTAQAVMKFLVDPGGIVGLVFSALAATTGAFQLAAINSAPIPAYAEGRDGGKAERAIVGEAGREIVRTDKGFFLTPNAPTLVDLPAGADVIPNDQIAKFMSGQIINDDLPDQMLGSKIDQLNHTLKNKEFVKFEVTRAGMALVAQNGLNKTRYINQNLRR